MKIIPAVLGFVLSASGFQYAQAQVTGGNEWSDPAVACRGNHTLRTEFISYDIRELAEKGATDKNEYYVPLSLASVANSEGRMLSVDIDVPYMWLDRDLFIQISGYPSYYLYVGDKVVGYGEDSRTPTQFNLSGYVKDGPNTISLLLTDGTGKQLETALKEAPRPDVFLFSQPKLRIEDFTIALRPDTAENRGVLDVQIVVSNSYNFAEEVTVGYDIYSPQKKLEYYDFRPMTVPGQGYDTLTFSQHIYRTPGNQWSAEKPGLYYGMLTVKRDNRMTEYVPYRTGYGITEYADGKIMRNGKVVDIKAAGYNAAADRKSTSQHVAALKKQGINTLCPDYPQPAWFYDICDEAGMYVIDRANINSGFETGNRKVGGALSNNPGWLGSFMARSRAAYYRTRNHTCIIGWSLGGDVGNGFNMYRTYLWFKSMSGGRAVVFNDAQGEWNSDMQPIDCADGMEIISRAASSSSARKK